MISTSERTLVNSTKRVDTCHELTVGLGNQPLQPATERQTDPHRSIALVVPVVCKLILSQELERFRAHISRHFVIDIGKDDKLRINSHA